ncbi:septum formation inhibitor Maf [Pontimicrobium sp. MEBiC06410]
MKRLFNIQLLPLSIVTLFLLSSGCKNEKVIPTEDYAKAETPIEVKPEKEPQKTSQEFNDYWYAGEAEISSYKLEQARYGEIRNGYAVLVYVTEPFLNDKQVKADYNNDTNIPVLKLNSTKKFNTGIYPYSIMQSTFYPVSNNRHALKVSGSVQEWCGHVYTQINNRDQFDVTSHSYFESEADQDFSISKTHLENEIWTQLRINPKSLPVGTFKIIPSIEYVRLKHKKLKAYNASAKLKNGNYTISYPELNRTLSINFTKTFPYTIESWEETINGLTTKATKLKTIKSPYWSKNSNKDETLRKTLQLD